tara:strand:- start:178 stop:360 length:183 start_codon:yes stop_codon:yes gene_type:complete
MGLLRLIICATIPEPKDGGCKKAETAVAKALKPFGPGIRVYSRYYQVDDINEPPDEVKDG